MLTALAIDSAKPRESPYKIADGNGLHLLVNPNGSKLWRLRYRFGGKQLMLSLGSFPEVSLASARTRRDDARKLIADGKDPSLQRKLDKAAATTAASNTFRLVAEEYLRGLEERGCASHTLSKNRWLLTGLAAPLAERPIGDIKPAELLSILKRVEKSGRKESAKRLRSTVGAVFRLAVAYTLRAETDPTYALRGALTAPTVTHRAAITDEKQFGALLASIDEYDGWPTIRAAMQFLALTMVRPGEVRFMRRSEVIWPKATWQIPAERMKMRRPFEVPLSTQALGILRSVWDLSEGNGYVFPSIRSAVKPLSENAMNSALRRIGYAQDEMCSHGFRSSASTILNDRGHNPEIIEVALAHRDTDRVRSAYNRNQYWQQRQKLLQAWADLLDEFRKPSRIAI